ncbi:Uncharacterized protein Rs2_01833 [Raphanus sativus]|nr:Uncharacterized protein Rs2_01833 [Raphanus sativus]
MFALCPDSHLTKKLENFHRSLPLLLAQSGSWLKGAVIFPGMLSSDGTSKPPLKWRRVLLKDLKSVEQLLLETRSIISRQRLRLLLEEEISFVDPPGLGAVALSVPLLIVSGIKSILDFLVPDECVFFSVEFHQWSRVCTLNFDITMLFAAKLLQRFDHQVMCFVCEELGLGLLQVVVYTAAS